MSKKNNRHHNRAHSASSSISTERRELDLGDDFFEPETPARQDRTAKRAKFANQPKKTATSSFNPIYVVVPAALIIIVGFVLFLQNQSSSMASADAPAANAVREVPITHTVADGKISIPVEEVRKNKLVIFDYNNGSKTIPLTAWVTPSGAIKSAVRVCEPCNGTSFRIEGNTMVCNTCGTRWDLETLRGISGGCQKYPPEALPSTIAGDNLVIDEAPVLSWQPRVF